MKLWRREAGECSMPAFKVVVNWLVMGDKGFRSRWDGRL